MRVPGGEPDNALFSMNFAAPAGVEQASLQPHPLVVQRAVPIVAETTFRLEQAEPDDAARAAALARRARARAGLRQFDPALADLEQAIALAPAAAE